MPELKNRISRIALLHAVGLGIPMLAGCDLRLPQDDSNYNYSYDDQDRAAPPRSRGGTNPAPIANPGSERDLGPTSGSRPPTPPASRNQTAPAARPEPSYEGPGLSTYVELVVLDPRSVGGPHASNADQGAPWSFRAQMGWLAGSDTDALAFTVRWLDAWQNLRSVGTTQAPVSERPQLHGVLLTPWLGDDGAGEVSTIDDTTDPDVAPGPDVAPELDVAPEPEVTSEGGRYAPAPEVDAGPPPASAPDPSTSEKPAPEPYGALPPTVWAAAPFRLLAIVNRVDLAADACGRAVGELRYVYTATDPRGERALDLSVIVEIPYPSTRSAASWARSWQGVAAEPAGLARDQALLALTGEVTRDADPLRARVRTNEAALSEGKGPWQMREFNLASSSTGALELRQVPLTLTPRSDADLGELAEYLLSNSADVLAGGSALPESLRAGAAEMSAADFSWRVPGISERLRSAFSGATCNGCHAGDTKTERFQHIAPGASLGAPARLSRFLYDDSPTDELHRREALLVELSGTACSDDPPSTRGYR